MDKEILAICDNINGPRGHYAKWNKSDRESQILNDLSYMWNLEKNLKKKQKLIDTDWWLSKVGGGGWEKWVKGVKM